MTAFMNFREQAKQAEANSNDMRTRTRSGAPPAKCRLGYVWRSSQTELCRVHMQSCFKGLESGGGINVESRRFADGVPENSFTFFGRLESPGAFGSARDSEPLSALLVFCKACT